MKTKQLKHWIDANPQSLPICHVVSHAGGAPYLLELKIKSQVIPLRDRQNQVMRFDSLALAKHHLKRIGLHQVTLRVLDPYDEMCALYSCDEDIVIPI